jgi:excisionase family DNA binding protein
MQDHDARRMEASPRTRLLHSEDRLTWTITEAAQLLGISRATAYEAAHRGELPVRLIGRRMLCCACSSRTRRWTRGQPSHHRPWPAAEASPVARRRPSPQHGGLRAPGGLLPGWPHPARPQPPRPRPRSPGSGSSRRPRWDTDPGITDRDVAALRWLGQQYAARSDVLRVLLGRLSPGSPRVEGQLGEETLRQILDRWEDRGLVARDRLLGHLWVAPTAKALRLVGLNVRAWSFVFPQLAHVHAVGVVRLALEPSIPEGGRWLSERELRREAGKSHVPDGAVQLPDNPEATASAGLYGEDVDPLPKRVAVEVELTRKGAARLRESWTRPAMAAGSEPSTTPPPEIAGYLAGQLQRIRPRHPIQVHPLPDVPGTTYLRPGGAS